MHIHTKSAIIGSEVKKQVDEGVYMRSETLIKQLLELGFKVEEDSDRTWIRILLDEGYSQTEIVKINKYIPHWFSINERMVSLGEDDLYQLLPIVFNYILRSISKDKNGKIYDLSNGDPSLDNHREELIEELLKRDGRSQQELMSQLAELDRKLEIKDEFITGHIIRMIDLMAILKDYGYPESILEGTTLTIVKDGIDIIRMDTDRQMDIQALEGFSYLTKDEQTKLQLLVTAYGATPEQVRKIQFSFLEQALIASMPSQYHWLKRESTPEGPKLYMYSSLEPHALKEELICDPKLFRMATLKNQLPTYLPRRMAR